MMEFFVSFMFISVLYYSATCKALDCRLHESRQVAFTYTVDRSGKGNFTTIQSAIDAIPQGNSQWIRVQISPEIYREKVTIPENKPCIFLKGSGRKLTIIEWGDHETTNTSATFSSYADHIVAKGITFKNTYNLIEKPERADWKQAVAARIRGDKSAFYRCAFLGVQDTLWDENGRHLFQKCFIEGAVDFIFGKAKSIYKRCLIYVNIGRYEPELEGYITAQKKEWEDHESGFVLRNSEIKGIGKAYLGRAWGPYSTVIIHNTSLSGVVLPQGWNAWNYVHHEKNFTYVEVGNEGEGADTSKRVPWLKQLHSGELAKFLSMSYIDPDGWLPTLPILS